MIETICLFIAWATFGYAVALIEYENRFLKPKIYKFDDVLSEFLKDPEFSVEFRKAKRDIQCGLIFRDDLNPRRNVVSLKHRADRFPCYHCKRFRCNERFLICWCDHDRREFPDLCDEYDSKHGNFS